MCVVKGCNKFPTRRFCVFHYMRYRNGILDRNGRQLRQLIHVPKYYSVKTKIDGKEVLRILFSLRKKNKELNSTSLLKMHVVNGYHVRTIYEYIRIHGGWSVWKKKAKLRSRCFKKFFKCIVKGCKSPTKGKFCTRHRNQLKHSIIDGKGRKLRDLIKPVGMSQKYYRCVVKGCKRPNNGRFCSIHRSRYNTGVIDRNGKILRKLRNPGLPKRYHQCTVKGCKRIPEGRFCPFHWSRRAYGMIDNDGNKLREKKHSDAEHIIWRKCLAKECSKMVTGQKWCGKHRTQYYSGILDKEGNKIRELRMIPRAKDDRTCIVKGCGKYAPKHRMCAKHCSQYYLGIIDRSGNKIREPFQSILESPIVWEKAKKTCKGVMEIVQS